MQENFDVAAYVQARQKLINDALAVEIERAGQAAPPGAGVERLLAAMRYSLLAGGKRLRPLLFLAALESLGQAEASLAAYLPFACGIEMLHTYSLIHDDLPAMDDDDLRRGRPSCHKAFDEATAILAGDGLLTHCFCRLLAVDAPAERIVRAGRYFAWQAGVGGMVAGQALDLAAENAATPLDLAGLRSIHASKTGALLEAAVVCGAILAGADERQQRALADFGRQFGLAFQITDDILDVVGEQSKLGKPVGSDAANHKTTYVSLFGLDGARQAAEKAQQGAQNALLALGERGELLAALTDYFCRRDN